MKFYLFAFLLIFNLSNAHKNVVIKKQYGNITVYTSTSFYTEEINKGLILGQYAEKLSKNLNYSGKIILYLKQVYREEAFHGYYGKLEEDAEKEDGIILMLDLKKFDIRAGLNIVEHAIQKGKRIKSNMLGRAYSALPSKTVIEVLDEKIYRPNEVDKLYREYFSYYYYQNQFYFYTIKNQNEVMLMHFDDVFDFNVLQSNIACIFKTKGSCSILGDASEIAEFSIENPNTLNVPYIVKLLGNNKIFIAFHWSDNQERRVLLYNIDTKYLVQDIDKILK